MDVAKRLKVLREGVGLSKGELGRRAGLSESYIGQIESRKKRPTVDTIFRICEGLGITVQEFFSIDQDISAIPTDIWKLVSDKNNYGLLKEIQARKNKGISNELIIEWLKSLDKTLEMVKQKGVYWVESEMGETDTYSDQEKKEIIKGLEEKLKDPNFKRPWKKET